MRSQLEKLLVLLVAVSLVAVACGASTDDDAATDAPGATADADEGADAAIADERSVAGESDSDDSADTFDEASEADGEASLDSAAPASADAATAGGALEPEPDADRQENNTFQDYGVRPFVDPERDPLSTFALDVDTASYAIARSWVGDGAFPPAESVRVEEFVNSFDYDYPAPDNGLAVVADGGPSPYNADNVMVRLGVQAEEVPNSERPPASLTFVVDTSGSMDRGDRLGLVKTSLQRLVIELESDDTVALVTYSDNAEVLLPPTSVADEAVILDAIDNLRPTGSTNLESGLQRGYDLANESFQEDGINRVILASDGVANVGLVDPDGLVSLIRDDADKGIQLVTIGVGMGNFNDTTMEQLANDGDGFYAYVNDETEAQKLFTDDLVSTLLTVALDAKIQVEFSSATVAEYRLIGFENRAVLDEDFRNDDVDAGELGAGHQVTALYELVLQPGVDTTDRIGTAQLRWEDPDTGDVSEVDVELDGGTVADGWDATSDDFKLAVTVASLAEVLRNSPHVGEVDLDAVAGRAEPLSSHSTAAAEFIDLVDDLRRLR